MTKEGDKIFLDQRPGGPLDSYSVNENAVEPPWDTDLVNSPLLLAKESTLVNHKFMNQVLKDVSHNFHNFSHLSFNFINQ